MNSKGENVQQNWETINAHWGDNQVKPKTASKDLTAANLAM